MVTLEQHISRQKLNSRTGGDISTPLGLVQEMVNKIPLEVKKDPNKKFFDPAAGTGSFIIVLFYELKKYHSEEHILNNMLYAGESNRFKLRMLKNLGIKNIYGGSFPEQDFKDMKFDVIIGNPPYNDSNISKIKEANGKLGQATFYKKFIYKAFDLQKENGMTVFILPVGAFKDFYKAGFILQSSDFNHIKVFGKSIATMNYYATKGKSLEFSPTLQTKLFETNKDRLLTRLPKTHGFILYNFIKPLKIVTSTEWAEFNKKDKGVYLATFNIPTTELNLKNLTTLLTFLHNYIDSLCRNWISVNKRLKYHWLTDLDYEITEQDIIKEYNLTPEDINIIKNS
tara:strand:- start:1163 stop:2185 length:1023 start_codon:yes stop_codon:yes gene_type:complete